MGSIFSRILNIYGRFRNIEAFQLDQNFKKTIREIYLWTIVLKRVDSTRNLANISGYRLNYLSYRSYKLLFHEIFLNQEYRFTSSRKRPLIIDCGSNIGMSILYFKMLYPDSRIIGFEPDDNAFSCLEKNIKDNNLQSVEVYMKAVSGSEGVMDFYYDPDNLGALSMSIFEERKPKQRKSVDTVVLSKYIVEDVDFLKIDIEGAEINVIQELSNSGKLYRIKQMVIEYHHHIVSDQDVLSTFLNILESAGFGYQIIGHHSLPFTGFKFQDILIYAYQKNAR